MDCHGTILEQTFDSDLGDFAHVAHVEDMGIACAECHGEVADLERTPDLEVCSACH